MTLDPTVVPYVIAIVSVMITARVIWINGAWIVAGIVYGAWMLGVAILIVPFALAVDILFATLYVLLGKWDDYESITIGTWNDMSTKYNK